MDTTMALPVCVAECCEKRSVRFSQRSTTQTRQSHRESCFNDQRLPASPRRFYASGVLSVITPELLKAVADSLQIERAKM